MDTSGYLIIAGMIAGILIDAYLIVKMVLEHIPKKKSANNSLQKA